MTLQRFPRILLTGATGWLGQRVALALTRGLSEPATVKAVHAPIRCLVPSSEATRDLRALGLEICPGSVTDPVALRDFVADSEGAILIHLAGIIHPPGRVSFFDDINVDGTARLVDAALRARVARTVVMSSNSPFGGNATATDVFTEASPYKPYMGYGRSKWRMEEHLREVRTTRPDADIVVVRAPWFYGPGQPPRQTRFFEMIRDGRFPLFGNGSNRRSMAYVDSLAYGLLLAADVPSAGGETFWIADETPYAMHDIVATVRAVMAEDFGIAVKPSTIHLPGIVSDLARVADALLQAGGLYQQEIHVLGEMNMNIACDIAKARRELGYQPLVTLREGMRRSIDWMLSNGTGDWAGARTRQRA